MERINRAVAIYAYLLTFLLIWGIVLLVSHWIEPLTVVTALQRLPVAVTLYAFAGIAFTRWIWKWKCWQGWLVYVPNLQGTWRGELRSDWVDPSTQLGIEPIPVLLTIRQTFLTTSCTLMTAESRSYSIAADFNRPFGDSEICLTYLYTNRPKAIVRDRSAVHDGAAMLQIIKEPTRRLEGEYWTSRKTRGELSLTFKSPRLAERFA
jgi:hypothetical protein